MHDREEDARQDAVERHCHVIYSIDDPEGFSGAEAKDLYHHGIEAMSPAWGIAEIELV